VYLYINSLHFELYLNYRISTLFVAEYKQEWTSFWPLSLSGFDT
jgi:hypothetical protein